MENVKDKTLEGLKNGLTPSLSNLSCFLTKRTTLVVLLLLLTPPFDLTITKSQPR